MITHIYNLLFFLLLTWEVNAQEKPVHLYDPAADASIEIAAAVKQAAQENKHVLIQAGGNWCSWCIEFNRFCKVDLQIDSLIKASYIVCHLNYSKENLNKSVFASLGFPQRFGFPVFIILNGNGERIHTQNSGYLESGKSYDRDKVLGFLGDWTQNAMDPVNFVNYRP
jgi:hypothetical protein